ncbi:hypothetical protein AcV7_003544 [Taiwanofungus camphoratus]|nr:hypothetical protein AcV7_003544 [Antrodia cinnamomea]
MDVLYDYQAQSVRSLASRTPAQRATRLSSAEPSRATVPPRRPVLLGGRAESCSREPCTGGGPQSSPERHILYRADNTVLAYRKDDRAWADGGRRMGVGRREEAQKPLHWRPGLRRGVPVRNDRRSLRDSEASGVRRPVARAQNVFKLQASGPGLGQVATCNLPSPSLQILPESLSAPFQDIRRALTA